MSIEELLDNVELIFDDDTTAEEFRSFLADCEMVTSTPVVLQTSVPRITTIQASQLSGGNDCLQGLFSTDDFSSPRNISPSNEPVGANSTFPELDDFISPQPVQEEIQRQDQEMETVKMPSEDPPMKQIPLYTTPSKKDNGNKNTELPTWHLEFECTISF